MDWHEGTIDWGLWAFRGIILLAGAAIGSFLAAAAWRLPRDRSLLAPSRCVQCGTRIPVAALLPVVGWLVARGRCHACGSRVSPHYAVVELVTAVLTLLVFEIHGPTHYVMATLVGYLAEDVGSPAGLLRHEYLWNVAVSAWLLYTGVVLSLIDFEFRILPDVITLPGIVIGFLMAWADPNRGWVFSSVGILSGAGALWLIAFTYRALRGRDGMGLGDVKYLGMIGAVLGWSGVLWTMMMASLFGSVVGLVLGFVSSRLGAPESNPAPGQPAGGPAVALSKPVSALQLAIPFGPFLALGAFVYSLFERYFLVFLGGGL